MVIVYEANSQTGRISTISTKPRAHIPNNVFLWEFQTQDQNDAQKMNDDKQRVSVHNNARSCTTHARKN